MADLSAFSARLPESFQKGIEQIQKLRRSAPKGNKTAWKHGRYPRERVEASRKAREALWALETLLENAGSS